MSQTKNILLTFDYELFLGSRSGNARNCIIQPTNELLKVLSEINAKAIFFVDILYLTRLREISVQHLQAQNDYTTIEEQIINIANSGHYVYLHLHPHWLDAVYKPEINQWDLSNTTRYSVCDLSQPETDDLLLKAYNHLNEILLKSKVKPAIEGFRAGGLFIQPFEKFYHFFKQKNICYEFSVYPGFSSKSNNCVLDFSHAPSQRIYHFEDDCCIVNPKGYFKEYSISQIHLSGLNRIINSFVFRFNTFILEDKPWGSGKGAAHVISNNNKKVSLHGVVEESASVELMNFWKNHTYYNYLKSESLLHLLSHPKLLSPHNLKALRHFMYKVNKKYEVITDFKKFNL